MTTLRGIPAGAAVLFVLAGAPRLGSTPFESMAAAGARGEAGVPRSARPLAFPSRKIREYEMLILSGHRFVILNFHEASTAGIGQVKLRRNPTNPETYPGT